MARECLGHCALCDAEIQKRMQCGSVYGDDCWWVGAVRKYGPRVAMLMAGDPVSREFADWMKLRAAMGKGVSRG